MSSPASRTLLGPPRHRSYVGFVTASRAIPRPHYRSPPATRSLHAPTPKMLYSGGDKASPPSNGSASTRSKLIFAPAGGVAAETSSSQQAPQALQYGLGSLDPEQLDDDPLKQFHKWFGEAQSANVYQPETVTLATASLPSGSVSARVVFMKELDDRGFVVYSNWDTSRKAQDVKSNPQAALTFWWREMERQVRVEGTVEFLAPEESQVYYDTRIRGSRIGAWASPQSQVLSGREELEQRVKDVEKRFEGQEKIPVPPFWGGMRVVPKVVEFWQGRQSRLHDRCRYTRIEKEGGEVQWKKERLSP